MNLENIAEYIRKTDNIIITTHETPDADGLGAEYALCSCLLDLGKNARIINSDWVLPQFRFFDRKNLIHTRGVDIELPEDLNNWNLMVLDTAPSYIGNIAEDVLGRCKDIISIDHHSQSKDRKFNGWTKPDTSSTCEMIYEILEKFKFNYQRDVATAIYAGIFYDTGSFVYSKLRSKTFLIAGSLVSKGAVPNQIYKEIKENRSVQSLVLTSLVNSMIMLCMDDKIAIQIMTKETLIASGASYAESNDIINYPLQSKKIRVSLFLKENLDGKRRCSLRAKGEVDCAAISHLFNGGGHRNAAGFSFTHSFEEMQNILLELISPYLT